MKKLIVITTLLLFTTLGLQAQSLKGYTYHGKSNGVELYYKVSDYGISFAAKNTTSQYIDVLIENVSGKWSDNRTRTKNIKIGSVGPGRISKSSYSQADNYSKLKSWSFSGWRWN